LEFVKGAKLKMKNRIAIISSLILFVFIIGMQGYSVVELIINGNIAKGIVLGIMLVLYIVWLWAIFTKE
jgi:hypothetical protein